MATPAERRMRVSGDASAIPDRNLRSIGCASSLDECAQSAANDASQRGLRRRFLQRKERRTMRLLLRMAAVWAAAL